MNEQAIYNHKMYKADYINGNWMIFYNFGKHPMPVNYPVVRKYFKTEQEANDYITNMQ